MLFGRRRKGRQGRIGSREPLPGCHRSARFTALGPELDLTQGPRGRLDYVGDGAGLRYVDEVAAPELCDLGT